jgi:hypothetical protein
MTGDVSPGGSFGPVGEDVRNSAFVGQNRCIDV